MELGKLYYKYFYTTSWNSNVAYVPTKKTGEDTTIGYLYNFKEGIWYLPGPQYLDYEDRQWIQEIRIKITNKHMEKMLRDLFEKKLNMN